MYEKKGQPLVSRATFIRRIQKNIRYSLAIIVFSLLLGTLGYYFSAGCTWIDAFHNASMILSGMGPVITIDTVSGKIFSSFYALFSGLVFVTNLGILLAPLLHRILHHFHVAD